MRTEARATHRKDVLTHPHPAPVKQENPPDLGSLTFHPPRSELLNHSACAPVSQLLSRKSAEVRSAGCVRGADAAQVRGLDEGTRGRALEGERRGFRDGNSLQYIQEY